MYFLPRLKYVLREELRPQIYSFTFSLKLIKRRAELLSSISLGLCISRVKSMPFNQVQVSSSSFKFIQAYLLQVYDKYITKFGI